MAGFFNLTQVGFQNTIRERCKDVKEDPQPAQDQINIKYKAANLFTFCDSKTYKDR